MVIYNPAQHLCSIFEIKHSRQAVQEQARHLLDEDKLALTEQRFCAVAQRSVIYLGESFVSDDGIEYVNAESFLKELPSFEVQAAPVKEEEETAGPTLSM